MKNITQKFILFSLIILSQAKLNSMLRNIEIFGAKLSKTHLLSKSRVNFNALRNFSEANKKTDLLNRRVAFHKRLKDSTLDLGNQISDDMYGPRIYNNDEDLGKEYSELKNLIKLLNDKREASLSEEESLVEKIKLLLEKLTSKEIAEGVKKIEEKERTQFGGGLFH